MDTSATIKGRQYKRLKGVRRDKNTWDFPSESKDRVTYTTKREGREWRCGCRANARGKYLCGHVISAVLEDAEPRYGQVSIWTSEADARRQKRRYVTFTANGTPFYVTYGTRRLSLDNPDVKAVMLIGPWTRPSVELIFDWKKDRVTIPGIDLLKEAERRGWGGTARGRIRPGVAA